MMKRLILLILFGFTLVYPSLLMATPYGIGKYGSCTYDNTCTISLTTTGSVNLDSTPTASGVYTISDDEVTVTTNSTAGYTLTMESDADDGLATALVAPGSLSIAAVSGTPAAPQTLSGNTWGFRIDGFSGFGSGPTSAIQNQASNSLEFAAITPLGTSTTIRTNTTGAESGELTRVWYGLKINSSKQAASYTRTVVYTAIMQE